MRQGGVSVEGRGELRRVQLAAGAGTCSTGAGSSPCRASDTRSWRPRGCRSSPPRLRRLSQRSCAAAPAPEWPPQC
eukprot:scaffold12134_cov56-Isochrysis_galbana.AAC.1